MSLKKTMRSINKKLNRSDSLKSDISSPIQNDSVKSESASIDISQDSKTETENTSIQSSNQDEEVEDEEQEGEDDTKSNDSLLPDIKKNPPEEIATTAMNLGILFGFALGVSVFSSYKPPAFYLMSLSLFHFLEFFVTAKYNPRKVHKESFIINNGSSYTLAHTIAIIEVAIEFYFFPNFKKSYPLVKTLGVLLVIFGQILRSWAMITAGKSFSHLISINRQDDHELVTTGIYSVFRHPSYTGFFWWAVGTQLVLVNPISIVGFILILWFFFKNRIEFEEKFLIKFFGEKYEDYRKTASVYIPFIN
ncbi:Lamin-B receptor [Wickerhamomyces ciferrii]|uniref:Protein-S-isoprenylcysteine O-methyltransferase n=1 Tax=Wickerhamomyces ciferrii (strain ATCC 14091 / BCRC 22168 / CBS 111 / JCM 3599 / NBRC 0793 / NRRL Y-1031 F-60-10) TaxID=1206466 RepID=K0KEF9_WICCF|nr:Lamin-B receptor [Wickerhamomyces ciferrii]CCH41281.1 Lamin-B receptor [Wickerhamomyces ciferrii]